MKESDLSASFEEKAFESRAGPHQCLNAILGDLIAPGNVELLQQGASLADRRRVVSKTNMRLSIKSSDKVAT